MTQSTISDVTTKLPFSHGVEIENHLTLKETGEILVGDDLLKTWDIMFNRAFEYLLGIKDKKKGPKDIIQKIKKIEIQEVKKHGHSAKLKFIWVHYKLGKEIVPVNVFGPDPNISQITWLLELVTPPCEYLNETDWWITTLYDCAMHGLKKSNPKIVLLPIGLNPLEERFRSGLSCGSHHHIGIRSKKERIAVYNMLRNFVPHLIALTSTSPFINKDLNGSAKIRELNGKKQIIGRFTHSNRIANNTGQMGPNIPEYLPILKDSDTKKEFAKFVKKPSPDDRMVDVYPFTDYDTIELRFFDAQPFKENRLAIILLIQAISLKAIALLNKKQKIPSVKSSVLFENRNKSIELGLLAQFSIDSSLISQFPEFDEIYNFNIIEGKRASKLLDSVKSMIYYLKDELQSFDRPDVINYLLLPVFGTKEFEAPFSVTEYLVYEYQSLGSLSALFSIIHYKNTLSYPFISAGDISIFNNINKDIDSSKSNLASKLSSQLQKDIQKRKKQSEEGKQSLTKPSKKTPKKTLKKSKKKPIKKPTKKPEKKSPKKSIPTKINLEKKSLELTKIKEIVEPVPTTEEIFKKSNEDEIIISAFDIIEEEDLYIPAIEIEPKYTKIESKIANVMRKRRKEIEVKKKELYKIHLELERTEIHPAPKKIKLQFANHVSGEIIFGFVIIDWDRQTVYKLRKNPIYFYISAIKSNTEEKINLKTQSTIINTQKALETGSSHIPLVFSLNNLSGEFKIVINAITATNENIFTDSFPLTRKDDIAVNIKEFYINGDYGPVECMVQGSSLNSKLKGKMDLFLAVQEYTELIPIASSKLNLKEKEDFSFFTFVNLDPIFHSTPFFLVLQTTTGRFNKSKHFQTIRIKPITTIVVDWHIIVPEGKSDIFNDLKPKTKYEIDFVFHFNRKLPPVTIYIYLNTLPEGSTKIVASSVIKRDIDTGDEIIINKVKFKTPKNIGYLFFEVEIKTKEGFVPVDLISDPIGISGTGEK